LLASSVLQRPTSELQGCAKKDLIEKLEEAAGIDPRTLSAWMAGKRKHADVLSKADLAFVHARGQAFGGWATYLEDLVAGRSKYRGRSDLLGAYVRLFDAFDLHHEIADPKQPMRLRDKAERARSLLVLLGKLYAPLRLPPEAWTVDLNCLRPRAGRIELLIDELTARASIPDAPWTVFQYLLLVALHCSPVASDSLEVIALDLAAARWATHVLLKEAPQEVKVAPSLTPVVEALDIVRNLLDEHYDVDQAAYLVRAEHFVSWGGVHVESIDTLIDRLRTLRSTYESELRALGLDVSVVHTVRTVVDQQEMCDSISALRPGLEELRRSGAIAGTKVGHGISRVE
jgi:hypothetical protein